MTGASDRVIGGGVVQDATWRGYGHEGRAGRLVGRSGRKKRIQGNGAALLKVQGDRRNETRFYSRLVINDQLPLDDLF